MPDSGDDLLTYEEAAHEVGITLGSLKQVVNRGILHPIKISGERRKFLKREEVLRYRRGKHGQRALSMLTASNSSDSPITSLPPSAPHQEREEVFRFLTEIAARAWLANAEAYQASTAANAEAYQASTAKIGEAMLGMAQIYCGTSNQTIDQLAQRGPSNKHSVERRPPKKHTSNDVPTLIDQIREVIAQSGPLTHADEEAFQKLQDLLAK